MALKFYFSDITWRKLIDQQRLISCVHPDWAMHQVYMGDQRDEMLRPTNRSSADRIIVASLAVLSKTELDFTDFVKLCKKRRAILQSFEDDFLWEPSGPMIDAIRQWKKAKASGAGKIGAKISADNKKAVTRLAIDKIKDRWPMPSDMWPTKTLLEEADVSLNTAKAHLGKRPIAQYNYQAAQKRKERRNGKSA